MSWLPRLRTNTCPMRAVSGKGATTIEFDTKPEPGKVRMKMTVYHGPGPDDYSEVYRHCTPEELRALSAEALEAARRCEMQSLGTVTEL